MRDMDNELYINAQLGYSQFQSMGNSGQGAPNNKQIDLFNQQLAAWNSGNNAALLAQVENRPKSAWFRNFNFLSEN